MAYVYTFPYQITPAGAIGFSLRMLKGSGSETLTDKYFSNEFKIVNQTDLRGGELASPYAEFIIDDDVNDFFRSTIFPQLDEYSVFIGDNNAVLTVTLNDVVRFVGILVPNTIQMDYYYANSDVLGGRKTAIRFRCIWIFDFLKSVTAESLGAELAGDANYHETFIHEGVTYYWSSLFHIMRLCCDTLATNFGYTVNFSVTGINYTFYSNSFLNDTNFGSPFSTFYAFNAFRVSNATGIDSLTLDSTNNCIGIIVGTNSAGFERFGYVDGEEGNYAQTAYDMFVGILNSMQLMAKFSYVSTTEISVVITTRVGGTEKTIADVLTAEDIPFSVLSWQGVDVSSLISGNSVKKTFVNSGVDTFQKELMFDFKNNNDLSGYVLAGGGGYNTIFSLTSPPVSGNCVRLIRDMGQGANLLENPHFDTDIDGWENIADGDGTWAWSGDFGYQGFVGIAKLTGIVNNSQHGIRRAINPTTRKLLGSFWININPLTVDSVNVVLKVYVDFYIGTRRFTSQEHILTGGESLNTFRLIASNYDYRYERQERTRIDGSSRDDGSQRDYIRRNADGVEVMYSHFGVRIVPTTFASGAAEVWIDNCKTFEGYINTPDIVAGSIEKNFVSSKATSLRKLTANGIITDLDIADFVKYDGLDYYVQRITHDFQNNETEIEAINYQ